MANTDTVRRDACVACGIPSHDGVAPMSHRSRSLIATGTLGIALAALPAYAHRADAFAVPDIQAREITWERCSSGKIALFAMALGDRLQCGTLSAPLDHHRPDEGDITLSVVRISVADVSKRRGTLFVNPGGPGGDAGEFAGVLAAFWLNAPPGDPIHGDKKRVLDAFDIVAVVPRGMSASSRLDCPVDLPRVDSIMVNRTAIHRAKWDLYARRISDGCRSDPKYPYISTEQTVYDHELVRRSLGSPTFNYYGVSYGTWIGAWYGATYPGKVGRMVLDSTMDFTSTFEENHLSVGPALQDIFDRRVAAPAIRTPSLYGLGDDENAVRDVLRGLVPRVHEAWVRYFDAPEDLMAAKAVSDWLQAEPLLDKQGVASRIDQWRFSEDTVVNARASAAAHQSLERIFLAVNPRVGQLSSRSAVLNAIPCNDTEATRDAGVWQDIIARQVRDYPARPSAGLMNSCVFAHGPNAVKPPQERLARAGKILILAAEFDTITPVSQALRMLNTLPNAKALVLRDSSEHGLFAMTDHPCIERTTARFLLDGRTPTTQLTECLNDPVVPSPTESPDVSPTLSVWRKQLRDLLDGNSLEAFFAPAFVVGRSLQGENTNE
ncbi:MAG: Tripeptidyl aminopeptidase [Luteibacter sp.]|nr:MAG: Tripeptidyl aminopeptidase [Luteibacter sp.]